MEMLDRPRDVPSLLGRIERDAGRDVERSIATLLEEMRDGRLLLEGNAPTPLGAEPLFLGGAVSFFVEAIETMFAGLSGPSHPAGVSHMQVSSGATCA